MFAAVERKGRIRAEVVPNSRGPILNAKVREFILPGSMIFTDEWSAYDRLGKTGYTHRRIKHKARVYVDGDVPRRATDGEPRSSADPAKWNEIKRLPYRQRRAIVHLQPYNGRNDQYRRIRRSLSRIAALNNIDKHRHLHVLQAAAHMAAVAWFGDPPAS